MFEVAGGGFDRCAGLGQRAVKKNPEKSNFDARFFLLLFSAPFLHSTRAQRECPLKGGCESKSERGSRNAVSRKIFAPSHPLAVLIIGISVRVGHLISEKVKEQTNTSEGGERERKRERQIGGKKRSFSLLYFSINTSSTTKNQVVITKGGIRLDQSTTGFGCGE